MEIGPILRSIMRNKVGAALIALQIAFTMTVVVNGYVLIEQRQELAARPSGVVEDELFHIRSQGFANNYADKARAVAFRDLELIRSTPGVTDATAINAIPLSGGGWSMGLQLEPGADQDGASTAIYMVDEHGIDTLGVELIAGRNFELGEIRERTAGMTGWPNAVIITESLGKQLWPDDEASEIVGRTVYVNTFDPMTVVGVLERLQAPWTGWSTVEDAALVPDKLVWGGIRYMVRTEPEQRDSLMPTIEEALARSETGRIVRAPESMNQTRKEGYMLDLGLARILAVIMVMLVVITAFGVVGLASFSVKRRTKQIGTRRALGATRFEIRRYFLVENFIITSIGVALGAAGTIGFNAWLVTAFGFPKVEILYVPIGMLCLWLIGLIAVLGPAERGASVPPAVATRTI